ncbi:translation factor pelota [Thecamonas trahens ATCC 50062]|uniref:Protein pelota homolog n=1 Tax=Thecamonas trahens ATCC 50062 TaxID=461836 RepID=A0A0L0D0Q7_THETB|nr:translation factor pelota [Thecamonas trahens ATCC 50062]KNC45959.1 translation factor pelota [Thecamonas trahens ATCC 50062]|eukprot:XP_013762940.1 translation factor pelota [Thecamonas trahens ATCC 50062]
MKLVGKKFDRTGSGYVVVIPNELDDLWHVYNLIAPGDVLEMSTVRKVVRSTATGSSEAERKKIRLAIRVERVSYEAADSEIRVSGRNVSESKDVKLGGYHSHTIVLNRKLKLSKDEWDSMYHDRLKEACDVRSAAEVAAVVMQEGLAYVCLITSSMTVVRQKIEMAIPRKRKHSAAQHDKALARFFAAIYVALKTHIDLDRIKVCILASPGFVNASALDAIMAKATAAEDRAMLEFRPKFLLAHSSSGHKHALKEVLADPGVVAQMSDTKAASEVALLARFFDTLRVDEDSACYGLRHVRLAVAMGAVEVLLLTDNLFRADSLAERAQYVGLVEEVRESGGNAVILSTLHVSGEQLAQLTGIAAILRFPIPHLGEHEDEPDPDAEDDDYSYESSSS